MSTPQEQAQTYVALLLSTGMAYEFLPESIAYRSFLDGFTAGAASNPDTKRLDWLMERDGEFTRDDIDAIMKEQS